MFLIISKKRFKALKEKIQTISVQLEALHRDYDRLNDTIHEELGRQEKVELEEIK